MLRLFSLIGLKGRIGVELLRIFSAFKGILSLVFFLALVIPSMELAFVGSLYVLLSQEKQDLLLAALASYGVCDLHSSLCDPNSTIYVVGAVAGVLLVMFIIVRLVHSYCLSKLNYEVYVLYTNRLLTDYLNMPPMRILSVDRNKMVNAIVVEVAMFGTVATELLSLITVFGTALFFFVGAAMMSTVLLGVSLAVGLSMLLINRHGYNKARRIGGRRVRAVSKMIARTYDILEGFRAVKLEGAEPRVLKRVADVIRREQRWRFDAKWNMLSINTLSQAFTYLVLFIIIFMAVVVMRLDVATMLTFMVVMGRLQKVFLTGQNHWLKIKQKTASLEIVVEMLTFCEQEKVETYALPCNSDDQLLTVSFENVGFCYPNGEWIHRHLSFSLAPGDRVLIQGQSGQGKSTLLYLLVGLLDPSEGCIYYNGERLTQGVFQKYRQHVAYAAADLHLFRSIRENLSLAGEFNDHELMTAIRRTGLEEVVSSLKGGLDGFIGENGFNLSLGERQRVMLARLFLKQPKFLLLDEATSNLDLRLEDEILSDLVGSLASDGILIMIAHKKPQNVKFNRILTMNEGELYENSNGKAEAVQEIPLVN